MKITPDKIEVYHDEPLGDYCGLCDACRHVPATWMTRFAAGYEMMYAFLCSACHVQQGLVKEAVARKMNENAAKRRGGR